MKVVFPLPAMPMQTIAGGMSACCSMVGGAPAGAGVAILEFEKVSEGNMEYIEM